MLVRPRCGTRSEDKVGVRGTEGVLKAELKRKGVAYAQLVEKLAAIRADQPNIRNKIARGNFLQCSSFRSWPRSVRKKSCWIKRRPSKIELFHCLSMRILSILFPRETFAFHFSNRKL